jgi:hypothetical protein
MTKQTSRERALQRFNQNTATHTMEVILDAPMHKHLRCRRAGDGSSYGFDIVTWPGHLSISGDMSDFVFRRETDMIEWFRKSRHDSINPDYWAGKLTAIAKGGCTALDEEALAEYCWSELRSRRYTLTAEQRGEIGERINDEILECATSIDEAFELLRSFEVDGEPFFDSDMHEWGFSTHSFHFLWCCHAIVWAIGQYDAVKKVGALG